MREGKASDQNGAALVTVLMIVAVMSVIALGLSQAVLAATERARLLDAQAQLRLYMAAGEEVIEARLTTLVTRTEGRLTSDMPGLAEPTIIPIEGGSVTLRVRDLSNCFNVNVESTGTSQVSDESGPSESLSGILEDAGLAQGDAMALAAAVGDWMDKDTITRMSGAEDAYYLGLMPAYRTSSQPLANLDELGAIRGFSPEIIERIEPVLCALPEQTENPAPPLNINTLQVIDAPRLKWAFSGALSLQEARSLILARPLGGWPDVETLLSDPALNRIAPEQRQLSRLGVVSSLLETSADVSYRGEVMRVRLLLELAPGQPIRVLRRERVE